MSLQYTIIYSILLFYAPFLKSSNLILDALDEVSKIGVKCRRDPGVLFAQKLIPNTSWIISNSIEKATILSGSKDPVVSGNGKPSRRFLCFCFLLADYQTIHNIFSNMLLSRDYCDWAVMTYAGHTHLLQALRQSARLENINLVWYQQAEKPRYSTRSSIFDI